ncbi:MAG: hypothetical protein AAB573_01410 [Patescibacteria group bacterium]
MERLVDVGAVWREHRGFTDPTEVRTLEKLRPRPLTDAERSAVHRSCLDDRYIPTVVRSPHGKG